MVLVLSGGSSAQANDLGDAVQWLQKSGADSEVRGYEEQGDRAHDHGALPLINSRNVSPGQRLEDYRCEDAPIDGFATMRTNGFQSWALRACYETMWERDEIPGFVTVGRKRLSESEIAGWVRKASAETDVPEKLIDTVVRYVSGYRPGLVSERGHQGLMQLRPKVLANLGVAHGNLLDPEENLRAGAHYLRLLTFRYKSVKKALAAFRDGPAVVEAAGGRMPSEHRYLWFVREVMRIYHGSVREFPEALGVESMSFVWDYMK